jgi:hypothetical protein
LLLVVLVSHQASLLASGQYNGRSSSSNSSRRVGADFHQAGILNQEGRKVSFSGSSRFISQLFFLLFLQHLTHSQTRPDPHNHPIAVLLVLLLDP